MVAEGARSSMDADPKHYVDGLKAHVPQNRYLSEATFFLLRYFSSLLGGGGGDFFSIIQLM